MTENPEGVSDKLEGIFYNIVADALWSFIEETSSSLYDPYGDVQLIRLDDPSGDVDLGVFSDEELVLGSDGNSGARK